MLIVWALMAHPDYDLIGLAMIGYPLAGLLHGHPLSKWLIPGSFPCPTTALALVFIANASPVWLHPLHWVTFGLLLPWAIPFPPLIQIPKFGVFENGIMLASGLFALAARIVPDRRG